MVNEKVFKSYDIRGTYPDQINEKFSELLAYSLAKKFNESILLATDARLSSPTLKKSFVKAYTSQGLDVYDLGIISTPAAYFALLKHKKPTVIITASHNPKEYNGFKILDKEVNPVHGDELKELRKDMKETSFKSQGNLIVLDIKKDYFDFLETFVENKDANILLDQSNGSGILESEFLEQQYNATILNKELDGNFPGHEPDPTKSSVQEKLRVKATSYDFTAIFDGDADRAIFLDEKGNYIRPEILMSVIINQANSSILYDVRSSQTLKDKCLQEGVETKLIETGRTNFLRYMKKLNSYSGVEGSGHYFFKDFEGLDSAILMIIKVANSLGKNKLSQLTQSKYYHTSEINFRVSDRKKAIQKIVDFFQNPIKKMELDGTTLVFEDYWLNIRESNTEPVIRINGEANTKEKRDWLIQKINECI